MLFCRVSVLRSQLRKKDGKEHAYWSVVENQRLHDGRVVQRQVLYLGEANDSQRAAWRKTLDAHTPGCDAPTQIALFPHDHPSPTDDERVVRRHELRRQLPERDKLLMALGAEKQEAGRFYALLKITVPAAD